MSTLAIIGGALSAYAWSARNAVQKGLSGLYQTAPYQIAPRHKVSLVTIAYNEENYIGNLLASARNQTAPFSEMVVADCSDNSLTSDIARSYGARVVQTPRGNLSLSRNNAARACQGEVLVFCDADIILAWDFVERSVKALEQGFLAAHPRKGYYDSQKWNLLSYISTGILKGNNNISGCFAIWSKVFWGMRGFNEGCIQPPYCFDDMEFSKRFVRTYGTSAARLLPPIATMSARRLMKQGYTYKNWATPIRAVTRSKSQELPEW